MGTWSYYASQLATSTKDQVRLLIGDVVESDQQLQDEEVNWAISFRATAYGAAAECTRMLANRYSRSVDQQAGQNKVFYSQMAKAYALKAEDFELKAAVAASTVPTPGSIGAMPYAGGISELDKFNQEIDPDRVKPQYTLGFEDDRDE